MWEEGKHHNIKLSACGLVYKHFGKEIVKNATKQCWNKDLTAEEVDHVHEKIYKKFVLEIDAIDNGVSVNKEDKLYSINSGLGSRIGRMNAQWNCTKDKNDDQCNF
jgi:uncharacterized UPF0160 family protein